MTEPRVPIQYIYIENDGMLYKAGNEPDFNSLDDGMTISSAIQKGAVLNVNYVTKWWVETK